MRTAQTGLKMAENPDGERWGRERALCIAVSLVVVLGVLTFIHSRTMNVADPWYAHLVAVISDFGSVVVTVAITAALSWVLIPALRC